MNEHSPALASRHLLGHLAFWLAWALAVRPSWTAVLLMFSPFVVVPLGLGLASRPESGPSTDALHSLRRWVVAAAPLAAFSFSTGRGASASLLTVPWLVLCSIAAVIGIGRALTRRSWLDPTTGVDAALIFLAVGGTWLTLSRAGLHPLGFGDEIVQLTAVHFHYAGFAVPIVAGVVAQRCERSALVPVASVVGIVLTAIGITVGGVTEWIGATLMATAGTATAVLVLQCGRQTAGRARWCLFGSGLALIGGMACAFGWAWSEQFGWTFLDLEQMARVHGSLNALGFGFLGLIGLTLLPPPSVQATALGLHIPALHRRGQKERLANLESKARHDRVETTVEVSAPSTPAGFKSAQWERPLPHGFEAGCAALRDWAGHRAASITISEPLHPVTIGETLALDIPVGLISVSATCRIVDVVDEPDRYGFTYAALPHHPIEGAESFTVERRVDATATIAITAVFRESMMAARLCPPLTRWLQGRAIDRYLTGVATFTHPTTRTGRADSHIRQ